MYVLSLQTYSINRLRHSNIDAFDHFPSQHTCFFWRKEFSSYSSLLLFWHRTVTINTTRLYFLFAPSISHDLVVVIYLLAQLEFVTQHLPFILIYKLCRLFHIIQSSILIQYSCITNLIFIIWCFFTLSTVSFINIFS